MKENQKQLLSESSNFDEVNSIIRSWGCQRCVIAVVCQNRER